MHEKTLLNRASFLRGGEEGDVQNGRFACAKNAFGIYGETDIFGVLVVDRCVLIL